MAHDVVLTGDGGGKVPALARSLHGRNRVARTLLAWMRVGARLPGFTLRPAEVNGGPGVVVLDGEQRLISVWSLEIAGVEIRSVSSVVNPDKLTHLGALGGLRVNGRCAPVAPFHAHTSTPPQSQPRSSRMTQARIQNPALSVPGALDALQQLGASAKHAGIPEATLAMVTLRASQINGCSVCVDIHTRELEHMGESSERIHLVAAWREAPYFSEAERAALGLAEASTRLADRPDPVPDDVWDEGARHYTERPARVPGGRHRGDQRVQPAQRHHPADHRRLRGSVSSKRAVGSRCLNGSPIGAASEPQQPFARRLRQETQEARIMIRPHSAGTP